MTNPSKNVIAVDDSLYAYILEHSVKESPSLRRLQEKTDEHILGGMRITQDQGQFLAFLVHLTKSVHILEIGTYTGYSTLWLASALPPEGKITACETREEFVAIGREYWKEAGVENKIDVKIGPAAETMKNLLSRGRQEFYDFIFIDADKENSLTYYELSFPLCRKGGIICIDNVLWMGKVADKKDRRPTTEALRKLNTRICRDERVHSCIIPIADGLTLVMKKA